MTEKHFSIGQTRATVELPAQGAMLSKDPFRKIPRSIYEKARDVPGRWPRRRRSSKHPATENASRCCLRMKRILGIGRLRLRGPCGAQFEFTLAAIAQNLRRLAKWVARPPPFAPFALRKRCKGQ